MSVTKQEPMPTEQPDSKVVFEAVMDDIAQRVEDGYKKYNTYLMTHNGRKPLNDAYQEAIDLVFYLRQEIMERDDKKNAIPHYQAKLHQLAEKSINNNWLSPNELGAYVICEMLIAMSEIVDCVILPDSVLEDVYNCADTCQDEIRKESEDMMLYHPDDNTMVFDDLGNRIAKTFCSLYVLSHIYTMLREEQGKPYSLGLEIERVINEELNGKDSL